MRRPYLTLQSLCCLLLLLVPWSAGAADPPSPATAAEGLKHGTPLPHKDAQSQCKAAQDKIEALLQNYQALLKELNDSKCRIEVRPTQAQEPQEPQSRRGRRARGTTTTSGGRPFSPQRGAAPGPTGADLQ